MNEQKQTAIEVFENDLRDKLCRQNDGDFIFSDLTGLYVDIIGVISKTEKTKAVIIYDYAKLLEQELQLYSGMEAYITGRNNKNKPETEVLNDYMRKISELAKEQQLYKCSQAYFEEIAELLGGKIGLITEFTELYRTVHGVIASNIHEFIRLGQTSETDMTAVI
jgi:hypothetical protein